MAESRIVYVVDDDDAVLDSLRTLLDSVGIETRLFQNAEAFLQEFRTDLRRPGCLLLDVRMPGISGITLLERLQHNGSVLPVILITGHGDIAMAVRAMKLGALDFVTKPFRPQALLALVQNALEHGTERLTRVIEMDTLVKAWNALTKREQEVFHRLAKGDPNKVIAYDLNISQRTVETHRARVVEKMGARSFAELVRMSVQLEGMGAASGATDGNGGR